MSLLTLFLVLIVLGVVTWAVTSFIPMPQQFKTLIVVVAVIIAVIYCLNAFGIIGSLSSVKVPTVK